jgi:A/G-specific adenine glycosylase
MDNDKKIINDIQKISLLVDWYENNGDNFVWRDKHYPLYRLIITEFFLWRTKASKVKSFIDEFFSKYPTSKEILFVSIDELKEDIRPLGLYNRRAHLIKSFFKVYNKINIPLDEEKFRNEFKIGQYISRYILTIYYDMNLFPVDANIQRILERLFEYKISNIREISKEDEEFLTQLLKIREKKKVIWSFLDFGRKICDAHKKNCEKCLFKQTCNSVESNV